MSTRAFPLATCLLLVVGCSTSSADPTGQPPAPSAVHPDPEAPDDPRDVAIHVARSEGNVSRIYAYATMNGRDVALLVDTGSQLTFLPNVGGRDGEPDVGEITFGGETRSLPGRPIPVHESDEQAAGRPVVGYLGADWFLEGAIREIDLTAAKIRTIDSDAPPAGWTPLPFEDRKGFLFVTATFDGTPVTLGFDTGAPHALWLGQAGKIGDVPVGSNDANGTAITLWLGTTRLALAGDTTRSIPVMRTTSFPSLEASNRRLGGKADGLFGLTSWPGARIRIDPRRKTIWLEP